MSIQTLRAAGQAEPALRDDPLLNTRLFVPPARPELVERPGLTARIEQGLRGKLTLITAPAGFGKTTLLSSWRHSAAGRAWPLAWVSLTGGENDPPRFWSYVIAALDSVEPGSGAEALALLRPPEQTEPEHALTALINALSGVARDFVLVLDDYHTIHNPSIHQAVGFLIEHMPPQMHVVIAGQEEPPLPLPRLRGRGQLVELNAADLRFTRDEAAAFLSRVMGLRLGASAVAALEERTEGWVAGLQLAALTLQGHDGNGDLPAALAGSHRFIADYLIAEVLHRQPAPVQDFLLQTAILDRFDAALCDALTGAANSAAMLDRLERANLFLVPLDEEGRWYRYHHLFGDFLQAHLQRTRPDQAVLLHRRAAAWYESVGLIGTAISHYVAAGDVERAADLIASHARAHFMRSEVASVVGWLDSLPTDLVRARPQLGIVRAWALAHDYRVEEAEHWLDALNASLAAGTTGAALSEAERLGLQGEMAAIRARLAAFRGETDAVIAVARHALDIVPPAYSFSRSEISLSLSFAYRDRQDLPAAADALAETIAMCRAAGNTRGVMYAVNTLGSLHTMRGRLRQAAALYGEYLQSPGEPSPSLGFIHAALARVLLEWNDLDGALDHATQAVALGKQGGDGKILLHSYVPLLLAQQARGAAAAALETAERLARISPILYHTTPLAEVWLAQGNIAAAAAWARTCGIDPAAEPRFTQEHETLVLARVLVADGRLALAISLLGKMLAQADAGGRAGSALSIRIWLALAQQAQGDTAQALAILLLALALAEREGYVRSFVEGGPAMAALLRATAATVPADGGSPAVTRAGIQRILAAFPAAEPDSAPGPATPAPALVEPLSEREIAVLRLLAAGLSNEQIARQLVVTVGTVKTHLRNAYGKLDVHSRTQALARARALQLI